MSQIEKSSIRTGESFTVIDAGEQLVELSEVTYFVDAYGWTLVRFGIRVKTRTVPTKQTDLVSVSGGVDLLFSRVSKILRSERQSSIHP